MASLDGRSASHAAKFALSAFLAEQEVCNGTDNFLSAGTRICDGKLTPEMRLLPPRENELGLRPCRCRENRAMASVTSIPRLCSVRTGVDPFHAPGHR